MTQLSSPVYLHDRYKLAISNIDFDIVNNPELTDIKKY